MFSCKQFMHAKFACLVFEDIVYQRAKTARHLCEINSEYFLAMITE